MRSTIIARFYVRSSDLILFITESLCSVPNVSLFPPLTIQPWGAGCVFSVSMSLTSLLIDWLIDLIPHVSDNHSCLPLSGLTPLSIIPSAFIQVVTKGRCFLTNRLCRGHSASVCISFRGDCVAVDWVCLWEMSVGASYVTRLDRNAIICFQKHFISGLEGALEIASFTLEV